MKRTYRWTLAPRPENGIVEQLAKEINIPEVLATVVAHRGITSYGKAKEFFRPQFSDLHDPFLMNGMDIAVARIQKAIQQKECLMVFGDYDVDGTNSVAMLTLFLQQLGIETVFYIPDRIKEGYGISKTGIDKAKEGGITLLISIDCGITAHDQVEYANSLGIDVIICDHHEPTDEMPNAVAVLDPLKPNCAYPFKHLCGCGVGFKLMQGVARSLNVEETIYNYIDFVTLATTADIVPLVGENRTLTKMGLEHINKSPRPGIRALIESSGTQLGKISTGQIVFILAPRINAVGRLGDASRAVQLLTSDNEYTASQLAMVLEEENRNRRKIDEDTFLKAQGLAESLLNVDNDPAIVLHHEAWHPGVIGIVASRLVEKYYRPTIMMTTVDGVAKGSARSIVGFDIYQALKRVEDKLLQFGGHKYAAGLTVAIDKVDEFRDAFNIVVQELMPEEIKTPEIKIDTEISLNELTPRFLKILKEFAPFGPSNMRPVFLAKNLETVGSPKIAGKDHLRMKIKQDGQVFDAIGFNLGSMINQVKDSGTKVDLVFSIDEHEWQSSGPNGPQVFPQLKIKDLRRSEGN
jgi:single-stranded-DNA-specific exonuclease